MQRRIGLAQALINNPELILLDEPTSGLDPIGTAEIKELIRDLREQGKTIVLSGHLLADMQDICDRIAILHRGELKELGKVSDLLTVQDVTQIKTRDLSAGGAGGDPRGDRPARRRARWRSTTRRRRSKSCSCGSSARATCTRAAARVAADGAARPPPAADELAGEPGRSPDRRLELVDLGGPTSRRPGSARSPARGTRRLDRLHADRSRPGPDLATVRLVPGSRPITDDRSALEELSSDVRVCSHGPVLWRSAAPPRRSRSGFADALLWLFLCGEPGVHDPRPAGRPDSPGSRSSACFCLLGWVGSWLVDRRQGARSSAAAGWLDCRGAGRPDR